MEQHEAISLCLDRDPTLKERIKYVLSLSNKYNDHSGIYEHQRCQRLGYEIWKTSEEKA